ncbi:SIS domain-containing protein [Cognatishimia sp. F0-27]|uniref:SIS domain-containing protein n=1 Tax=Cognatishimia sp. F0-27 TaxID=2816855 RepID=UPI001D0CCC0F|nr:SIS domain-containing protein [Cognatishimia sp. F0-27]MCC1493755.1 SIS domain-containing protein [Cognatishimia sp. F0-27]
MMVNETHMRREILEIPRAADRLLTEGRDATKRAANALREADPAFLVSVARGSSDHAATYLKYASELMAGLPVASVGPSVASVYNKRLRLARGACLAISQSGKSPDIVRMARMATEEGALTIALTNHPDSDLAAETTHALDLNAGPEQSVAATKTFVNSALAGLWLLAEWHQDSAVLRAIRDLPEVLDRATRQDWSELATAVTDQPSLFCLGRGPSYAMSNEAALKFKETCQVHAESYSSAEVLHGPVSIVETGFPVIGLAAADAAEEALVTVADALASKGAHVFVTSGRAKGATVLPVARTGHPLTDPLSLIVSFYAMVEQVARARGVDPDAPRHLRKVTETV